MANATRLAVPATGISFPAGLKLIHVGYAPIKSSSPPPLETQFDEKVSVPVPPGTKFVHVAVTAVDMCFGTPSDMQPSPSLSSIWFEILGRDSTQLSSGTFSFQFRAILQDQASSTPTGAWTGNFWVEVMCFA